MVEQQVHEGSKRIGAEGMVGRHNDRVFGTIPCSFRQIREILGLMHGTLGFSKCEGSIRYGSECVGWFRRPTFTRTWAN